MFRLLHGTACSNSPKPSDQTSGGGATAMGDAGEASSAGANDANGGHGGAGVADEAGSSSGGADAMSPAGASGAGGEAGGNPCAACASGLCLAPGGLRPEQRSIPDRQYLTNSNTCAPFLIQFMRDPDSGSLILDAQGFCQSGTAAAD